METAFTPVEEKISGVVISAYDVTLKMPATSYSEESPVTATDLSGISVKAEYNSGKAATTINYNNKSSQTEYTWCVAIPEIGSSVANDTINITINVYNTDGAVVDTETVSAVLVARS